MSGAGIASAKADMPRNLLAQIQGQNEAIEESNAKPSQAKTSKQEDGPVKAMTQAEEVRHSERHS